MYEYKVVPAPTRAGKIKGLKTTAERFAHSLAERINAEAAGGWRFLRTESLACEERRGLTGTSRSTQTVMICTRAFFSACPQITCRSLRPLARASVTYSCDSWVSMKLRVIRLM